MNAQRLVAVGRFSPTEEVVIVEPLFADTWFTGAVNAVDAPQPKRKVTQAEAKSCAGAYVLGESDYTKGAYNPPAWNTPEYDAYLQGYNDMWAEMNGRKLLR